MPRPRSVSWPFRATSHSCTASGPLDDQKTTGGVICFGIVALVIFFGGLSAWSTMGPPTEAAIAVGQIRSEGKRRIIQHFEGGIVRDILARDGDLVKAGQVLMRLDNAQSEADLEVLRGQRWALLAQSARLRAEADVAQNIGLAQLSHLSADLRDIEAVDGQQVLFGARLASLMSQLQILTDRIAQHEAALASARAQIHSQKRQLELLRREERDVRNLVAQGLERVTRLLELQRNSASVEGNLQNLIGQAERAIASVQEARSQIQQVRNQRQADVAAEARDVWARLNEIDDRLRAAQDIARRREVISPEDGTVIASRFFNVGAVVRPGEQVMDLVPTHDRLVVEVQLSPNDVDIVRPGLQAEIRLPGFKRRLLQFLDGRVISVANDVTVDERSRNAYYQVQVEIVENQFVPLRGIDLRPGMPAEIQIKTGSRSLFRYLAQPMVDSFHQVFRRN
ncbi:HlyD family type I secretion periplasmic adaptor subunit [Roseomonas aerophila]|uniref:Membrane fusion protein (MFP) family protein n=1 Tax=Teichococcus aerophilus TaxID=1224513 RepID=A0ABR7RUD2_9PROT|nr:HlyD family type I secretion periplasmic adaptor subunit [Pseudoroseomonas aerophila]MBC9209632.1 HlyD family type I secretion periplasmic adaptor subunit [Pseudoroseomonas aerophila]